MSSLFWANLREEKNQKKGEVENCIQQGMKEWITINTDRCNLVPFFINGQSIMDADLPNPFRHTTYKTLLSATRVPELMCPYTAVLEA